MSEVDAAFDAAVAAFPDVTVTRERFAAELARRLGDPLPKLSALRTDEVYLAIAILDGDEAAATRLARDYLVIADQVARRLRAPDQAADLRGYLHRQLLTSDDQRKAALADFTGRGDLAGYIKVIATRELVRVINKGRKESPIDSLLDGMRIERAPELSMLRARHGGAIADALRDALGKLSERDRALLRYSIVDGWSVDQVGKLYGVHRSTAARWIADARDQLATVLRSDVAAKLAINAGEVDSLIDVVRSRIDVSLARIL